jgi:lipoprotein-releasing system ATP-binding protein
MPTPVVRLADVRRTFHQAGAAIEVLRGIHLTINPGEIVALLGPSGSGKSTMLQAIGMLEGGFAGQISICGHETATMSAAARTTLRRQYLGFVYQFHHLLPDFTATENVALAGLVAGEARGPATARAHDLLQSLGLGHRLDHRPSQLSGGEQQRVAVARALANRPALVLADEPTGNLDEATAQVVFDELVRLVRDQGSAALIATHNERLAFRMDRVLRLHEGKLE